MTIIHKSCYVGLILQVPVANPDRRGARRAVSTKQPTAATFQVGGVRGFRGVLKVVDVFSGKINPKERNW